MKEQVAQTTSSQLDKDTSPLSESQSKRKQFLLKLPQPILVLGWMLASA